mgnify:CR=1 FL=1
MKNLLGPKGPIGPFDLPFNQLPNGQEISIADLSRLHYSNQFGWHYDAELIRRIGGRIEHLDKMHIDPKGNIIDR